MLSGEGVMAQQEICIGNSMICSDIWHKYHKLYFKIVKHNFMSCWASDIWDNLEISQVLFVPNIMDKSSYYLFITTTHKRFVIFTCTGRYFKLSWNTTALIKSSNCRNFSCSSTKWLKPRVACVTDVISPWLVTSVKQHPYP